MCLWGACGLLLQNQVLGQLLLDCLVGVQELLHGQSTLLDKHSLYLCMHPHSKHPLDTQYACQHRLLTEAN